MIVKIINTFIIPKFSAISPMKDIIRAIIPQQKPFMNPEIMLLYCGRVFCAQTIITGCANIVIKPINAKITIDIIGYCL